MGRYRFILSGGGTGGHIYPAVAIANELKRRYPDAEFLFVGAKDKMEMEKVPQAGYEIKGLWISGIQRKLTLKNLMFPFNPNGHTGHPNGGPLWPMMVWNAFFQRKKL